MHEQFRLRAGLPRFQPNLGLGKRSHGRRRTAWLAQSCREYGTGLERECVSEEHEMRFLDDFLFLSNRGRDNQRELRHLLCTSNMLLHAIEVPVNIRNDNTLAKPYASYTSSDRVQVIITNPPFGGMEEDGTEKNFPATYRTKETADLFLVLIVHLLRDGGRGAMVLPDGTLFGEGIKTRIKQALLEKCNLHTIARLPNGVFAPHTGIKTNLLFFTKGEPTKEIWYYEHPYPPGVKNYNKTKPIRIEEFEAERKKMVGQGGPGKEAQGKRIRLARVHRRHCRARLQSRRKESKRHGRRPPRSRRIAGGISGGAGGGGPGAREIETRTPDCLGCQGVKAYGCNMNADNRIVIDPAICHGRPVIRDTRMPVSLIIGSLAGGMSFDQLRQEYDLSVEDIRAALKFVGELAEQESFHPLPA